jgi:hypothetical protein
MATIAELKAVRQELNTKTPLLFQAEIYDNWIYFIDTRFKEPYKRIDFKIALIKEALSI